MGVGGYAGYAYLSSAVKGKYYDAVLASFMGGLSAIEAAAASDSYNSSLTVYPWGSNMSIANNGMYMLLYDSLNGGNKGDGIAREQLLPYRLRHGISRITSPQTVTGKG